METDPIHQVHALNYARFANENLIEDHWGIIVVEEDDDDSVWGIGVFDNYPDPRIRPVFDRVLRQALARHGVEVLATATSHDGYSVGYALSSGATEDVAVEAQEEATTAALALETGSGPEPA